MDMVIGDENYGFFFAFIFKEYDWEKKNKIVTDHDGFDPIIGHRNLHDITRGIFELIKMGVKLDRILKEDCGKKVVVEMHYNKTEKIVLTIEL